MIKIWKLTGNVETGELLKGSIVIAGIGEEQFFLLLPPDLQNTSWRYWKFASWIPGENPYTNMNHYFSEVLKFMKNEE